MHNHELRKGYLLLTAIVAAVGLVVIIGVASVLFSIAREVPVDAKMQDMIYRTSMVALETEPNDVWAREIAAGKVSMSDYMRTVFTGSTYLLQDKSDEEFALDLAVAIYNDNTRADEIAALLDGQSRNYVIEKILTEESEKYAPINGYSDATGTSVSQINVQSAISDEEGYAFGIRQVFGTISIEGEEARTDFFVDGLMRPGNISLMPAGGANRPFSLEWDAREELAGTHDVVILIRTSDGRGRVVSGGTVTIPEMMDIADDGVSIGSILQETDESWYRLDAGNDNAYVNFTEMTDDIAVSLYDMHGNLIGENDLHGTPYELLRGRKQEIDTTALSDIYQKQEQNMFYVRVQRSPMAVPSVRAIEYTMIGSKEVAQTSDGTYLAVLDDVGVVPTAIPTGPVDESVATQMITCKDMNSNEIEYAYSELSFLPLNGYLTSFSMIDTNTAEEVEIYPEFSTDIFEYAVVIPEGQELSSLTVDFSSQEGYAASITLYQNEDSPVPSFSTSGMIQAKAAENKITMMVTTFDGATRDYTLYLLNGDDAGFYCEEVLNQFPTSYQSGIWLLHALHPNYQFEAVYTGLTFDEVLNNEDNADRSLISSNYNPEWVKPDSPVYDGTAWRAAKREVVSYYLDPRNFLTPTAIFQYEKLSFDASVHTIEGIRAMTANSFLSETNPDYASILLAAGENAHISPYFLASRIIQEMGRNGESMLANGTLPGYEGYFNFYNIGSTPNPEVENGALINGAKYAMYGRLPDEMEITPEEEALLLPWTSPDRAIMGGALWIASSYVEIGQNTLYLQKFDIVANEDGLYQHQYAQNIAMAANEGIRYYNAYASQDMLDEAFVFRIPIYDNLPNEYGTLP